MELENYSYCIFCERRLDRGHRSASDANCPARAGSEPRGHSGFWRLRPWLASRPLWRLPSALQLPSGMARRTVRTALLPQLVSIFARSCIESVDAAAAGSMTAVTAITTVRPSAAGRCANAQHGHRDGQDDEQLSHRNGPLSRLSVKQRVMSSTSFVPDVKLWESPSAITAC